MSGCAPVCASSKLEKRTRRFHVLLSCPAVIHILYFSITVCGCLVTSQTPFFSFFFVCGCGKEIKRDAFLLGLLQTLRLSALNTPPDVRSVYRTMLLRRAAVLKAADDENVDSGAETAE